MGFRKFSYSDSLKINIIKSYIALYPYLKEYKMKKNQNIDNHYVFEWINRNIDFIENKVLKNVSNEHLIILDNGIINKDKGLEYIAYSLYYSESGLRNKINCICKNILNKIDR